MPVGFKSVTNLFGGALGADVDASIAAGELGREDELDELDDEPKPRMPMAVPWFGRREEAVERRLRCASIADETRADRFDLAPHPRASLCVAARPLGPTDDGRQGPRRFDVARGRRR